MEKGITVVRWKNAPEKVIGFTTKNCGGVSPAPFASLNFGIYTEDDKQNVFKNYKLLEQYSGIPRLVVLKQVHGTRVLEVDGGNFGETCFEEADGLFTVESGIALCIQTADCFPVFLAGKKGLAAIHCGWRSLNGGIIENASDFFHTYGDFPEKAYLGPGICKDCYEIKDDMIKVLNKKYSPEKALLSLNGFYKLDLQKLVINALNVNGITEIEVSGFSSCHSEGFYSYRRDKGVTGRMLSALWREK